MKRIKKFLSFVNESNQIAVITAHLKEAYKQDPIFVNEDENFYNFIISDADIDVATNAANDLADPGIFGEHISFEVLDLTVASFSKLKAELEAKGITLTEPEASHNVLMVRISKKHPTKIYLN